MVNGRWLASRSMSQGLFGSSFRDGLVLLGVTLKDPSFANCLYLEAHETYCLLITGLIIQSVIGVTRVRTLRHTINRVISRAVSSYYVP